MKQSQLFTKTRKEAPAGEVANKRPATYSAQGMCIKRWQGCMRTLPLGLRVVEKIKQIVREEMNKLGGQELIMMRSNAKELWEVTDRWSDEKVDVWLSRSSRLVERWGLAGHTKSQLPT